MLPPSLFSTYQRYKQDTNIVASWLASTALACGYAPDRLKHPAAAQPAPSSSGRLKGKDRKEAKAKQQQGPQRNTKQPKHLIAVADFVALAEFIASSKSSFASIPDFFVGALSRVISHRSSFRDRMARDGVDGDAASDEAHGYFVKILDQVRTTLNPLMPTTHPEDLPSLKPHEELNRFEKLKLFEPSQEFLDTPAPARPKPDQNQPSTSDTSYEAEQSATTWDVLFAWALMMEDLQKLRDRIECIWLQHREGLFDAATAALATNTAIDLARSIMEEVVPLAQPYGGCWRIALLFHDVFCLDNGLDNRDPGPAGTYGVFASGRDTLMSAWALLKHLLLDFDTRPLPLFREGELASYDPTKDREKMTGREKINEDLYILTRVVEEQMTVVRLLPDYPVEDELLRGLKELDRTREISFSLAFAAQVHLDIHHVLREHVTRAREDLLQASLVFDFEITAFMDFHKSVKCKAWTASNDKALQALQQEMQWVRSDPIHQARVKALKKVGMSLPPGPGNHRLLAWSPVVAGLMLFRFRAQWWKMAMLVNQAWGSVLYSAHLYDALQTEPVIGDVEGWQDMELVKLLFGHEQFYVGNRPQTRPEYLSKFCLSVGISATMFAPRGKAQKGGARFSSKPTMAKAGPRGLKGDAPVAQMFFARYLEKLGQIDWTPEHVGDILSHSRYEERDEEGDSFFVRSGKPRSVRLQEAAAGGPLSPEELIRRLALSLHAESLPMTFHYLKMHRICWSFLRVIREACEPVLQPLFTSTYAVREEQLQFIVGWIFAGLNGGFGEEVAEDLLRRCARVVGEMVKDGDVTAVWDAMAELGFGFEVTVKEGATYGTVTVMHQTPSLGPIPDDYWARLRRLGDAVAQQAL